MSNLPAPHPRLYTINSGADALEKDRRTLKRALKAVPPDGKTGGFAAWRMKTILAALDEHSGEKPNAPVAGDATIRELKRLGVAATELAREIEAGFETLRAEPSIARRREMARDVVGLKVGEFLSLMDNIDEVAKPDWAGEFIGKALRGQACNELMDILQMRLVPDEERA